MRRCTASALQNDLQLAIYMHVSNQTVRHCFLEEGITIRHLLQGPLLIDQYRAVWGTPELAGLPLWQKWKSLEKQWHLSHVLNVNLLSSVKRTECQWRSVVVAGSTCNSRSASLALIWQVSGFGKLGLDSAKIESTPFVGLLLLVESFLFTVHNPLLWLLKHSTVTSKLAG